MSHPITIQTGVVPIKELGAYADLGRMDGWGVSPDKDGMVKVVSPFRGMVFDHLPEEVQDHRMAVEACAVLRRRDAEISASSYEDALARRAGAALWLCRRDRLRCAHECGGEAAGWIFYPTCQGYNSTAGDINLLIDSRGLGVHLTVHVFYQGVYQHSGRVEIHESRTSSSYAKGTTELHKALHAELVNFACRLAEESYQTEVARAQRRLEDLRAKLAQVCLPSR